MGLRPLHDWAVITRVGLEEQTAGGIFLPDTAKEKPVEGIVVSIGPGRYKAEKGKEKQKKKEKKFIPTTVKPGQRVIFAKYMTTEVEIDGVEYTLVREEDILGTVEGASAPAKLAGSVPQPVSTKPVAKKSAPKRAAAKPAPAKKAAAKKSAKKSVTKKKTGAVKKTKKTAGAKKKTKAAKKTVKRPAPKAGKKAARKAVKKTAKKTSAKRGKAAKKKR